MIPALTPPGLDVFQRYGVNVQGIKDVIWQPQYDHLTYPAAGVSELNFFTQPRGQGSTSAPGASGAKTYSDTNLELAGQLSQPQSFLALALSFRIYPGVAPASGAPTTAANVGNFLNDVWTLFKSGLIEFNIGEKRQILESTLGKFPSQNRLTGMVALADNTTAAADIRDQIDYVSFAGPLYRLAAGSIPWGQNFNVKVSWPALVALPSGQPARIGCDLHGWLARAAQ